MKTMKLYWPRWMFMAMASILMWMTLPVQMAHAIPSMARQTGYACARCHTVFPELTPFGRQFKLGAYAMSSEKWDSKTLSERIPLSAVLQVGRTSTSTTSAGVAIPTDFPFDRQNMVQTAGVYWGGKFTDNSGALIQYNYSGTEHKWGMEMFDARYADSMSLGSEEFVYGLTLNNTPTVSDIYGATPAWGYPHNSSVSPVMPAASMIDMTLAQQVAGVGFYGLWNDLIYAELASYQTARTGAFRFVKLGDEVNVVLDGSAPYWRFALQQQWDANSVAIGTYGMIAKVLADPANPGSGFNRFRDVAFDANYQYIYGVQTFSAHATWIREKQEYSSSYNLGTVSNQIDALKTFRADLHYNFRRQWGGAVQYFKTHGDTDNILYNTGDAVMGSSSGSPNSKGYVTELNYLPLENIKLGLRYTAFQQFNGASENYTPGRNASDNNNVFLYGWIMF